MTDTLTETTETPDSDVEIFALDVPVTGLPPATTPELVNDAVQGLLRSIPANLLAELPVAPTARVIQLGNGRGVVRVTGTMLGIALALVMKANMDRDAIVPRELFTTLANAQVMTGGATAPTGSLTVDVCHGADETVAEAIAALVHGTPVEAEIVKAAGPGGGWPEVRFHGPIHGLVQVAARYVGPNGSLADQIELLDSIEED